MLAFLLRFQNGGDAGINQLWKNEHKLVIFNHVPALGFLNVRTGCGRGKECIRVLLEMNTIFLNSLNRRMASPNFQCGVGVAVVMVLLAMISPPTIAQMSNTSLQEFKSDVSELSAARLNGGAEVEAQQEKALSYLDTFAMSVLNSSTAANLVSANERLAALVSHTPPVGENYRLLTLGGSPAVYAMVVNFGLGGPAAVRIYAGAEGHYALAARIDHFAQKDFFDSDIELVPVSSSEIVFVTIGGRTDDLVTGMFSAWRFDGHRVVLLWTSDLLQQSNYQADSEGFHLTYCGQPDDDHPSQCLKMTRDLYRSTNGEWKRISTADLPPAMPSAK
jgi:hypothetical protein